MCLTLILVPQFIHYTFQVRTWVVDSPSKQKCLVCETKQWYTLFMCIIIIFFFLPTLSCTCRYSSLLGSNMSWMLPQSVLIILKITMLNTRGFPLLTLVHRNFQTTFKKPLHLLVSPLNDVFLSTSFILFLFNLCRGGSSERLCGFDTLHGWSVTLCHPHHCLSHVPLWDVNAGVFYIM